MYLFDTDIMSLLVKRRPPDGLTARLAATPIASQFTTAVNVAEIYHGIFRLDVAGGRGRVLLEFFESQLFPRLTVLPFEKEDARVYGRLKAELGREGRPRFEPDLQIAAVALRHRLIVVTGNVRHFAGIPGLRVENWIES
jgi:predicted nucleic acid-binding protein